MVHGIQKDEVLISLNWVGFWKTLDACRKTYQVLVTYIGRDANSAAHNLAICALQCDLSLSWEGIIPPASSNYVTPQRTR